MANTIVKTPLIYQGGKTSIIGHLLDMVPEHKCYTESFCGGGSLFWSKFPVKNETINDRLNIVVNFYKVLQLNYRPLKRMINATLISRSIHNETLDIIRTFKKKYQGKISALSSSQRTNLAWAFWVRTNFSVMNKLNGGYKQEKAGGRSIAQQLQRSKDQFTEHLVSRIENTTIENTDAIILLEARNSPDTFHSLDPPYPNTSQDTYTYFGHKKFGWDEYEQILQWSADRCKGKFLLNSYPNELLTQYVKKYDWYVKEIVHQLKTPRKSGTTKTELLISNYASPCGTLKLF